MAAARPKAPVPNWSAIDDWVATAHEPSDEGPVAALSQADIEALVENLKAQADNLTGNWVRQRIADAVLILLVFAFVVLAIVQQVKYAPVDQLTINAPGGLPAFHVINDSDVVARKLPARSGSIASPKLARGRFVLQYLPKGSTLRENQLSRSGGWDSRLQGLSVIDIPVDVGPSVPPVETDVTLVASQRADHSATGVILERVPLLSLRRATTGYWATVALSKDQMESLKPVLGASRVFIARSTR